MSVALDPLQGSVKGPSQRAPNPCSWFLLRNPPNCPGDLIVIMQPVTRTRGQAPALTCLWCFSIYTPWTIHSNTTTTDNAELQGGNFSVIPPDRKDLLHASLTLSKLSVAITLSAFTATVHHLYRPDFVRAKPPDACSRLEYIVRPGGRFDCATSLPDARAMSHNVAHPGFREPRCRTPAFHQKYWITSSMTCAVQKLRFGVVALFLNRGFRAPGNTFSPASNSSPSGA